MAPAGCLYLFGLLDQKETNSVKFRTRVVYLDKHRQYMSHHFINSHASSSLSTFTLVRLWTLLGPSKSNTCVFAAYSESMEDRMDPRLSSRSLPPVPTSVNLRTWHREEEGSRRESRKRPKVPSAVRPVESPHREAGKVGWRLEGPPGKGREEPEKTRGVRGLAEANTKERDSANLFQNHKYFHLFL